MLVSVPFFQCCSSCQVSFIGISEKMPFYALPSSPLTYFFRCLSLSSPLNPSTLRYVSRLTSQFVNFSTSPPNTDGSTDFLFFPMLLLDSQLVELPPLVLPGVINSCLINHRSSTLAVCLTVSVVSLLL